MFNRLRASTSAPGRPKTSHSVRGKPISSPIPIRDDEFPIRNPGTGIAAALGADPDDSPPPPLPPLPSSDHASSEPAAGSSAIAGASGARLSEAASAAARASLAQGTSTSSPAAASGRSGSGSPQRPQERRAHPPSSMLRYSTVSATSTDQTPVGEPPQRKKSALRNAFGRLFGRGRKKEDIERASAALAPDASVAGPSQHQSDLSNLSRPRSHETDSPTRSASLPITDYARALRSHSVGPDDMTVFESAHVSSQLGDPVVGPQRRRAATTTSRLFVTPRFGSGGPGAFTPAGEWAGLSPRPASTHGRATGLGLGKTVTAGAGAPTDHDPDEIGWAITSDVANRRRSRSLSELQDAEHANLRRRSDEIRYWRGSYDPGVLSPLSSHEGRMDEDDGHSHVGDGYEDHSAEREVEHPAEGSSAAARRASSRAHEVEVTAQALGPSQQIPEPFAFGSVASMNEMAGKKITQAANIDSRIASMESRLSRVERIVDQLCSTAPGFRLSAGERGAGHVAPSEPSTSGPPNTASTVATTPSMAASLPTPPLLVAAPVGLEKEGAAGEPLEGRYSPSRYSDDGSFNVTMPPESQTPGTTQAATPPMTSFRPMSTSTVRGATSAARQVRDSDSDASQDSSPSSPSSLLRRLRAERAARKCLQGQVDALSRRFDSLVSSLSSSGSELLGPAQTGSVLFRPASSTQSTVTGRLRAPLSLLSAFEHDDEEEEGGPSAHGKTAAGKDDEDDMYSEAFQTPREERAFGAFGEELHADDGDDDDAETDEDTPVHGRRKAARTLSLSQLTHKQQREQQKQQQAAREGMI